VTTAAVGGPVFSSGGSGTEVSNVKRRARADDVGLVVVVVVDVVIVDVGVVAGDAGGRGGDPDGRCAQAAGATQESSTNTHLTHRSTPHALPTHLHLRRRKHVWQWLKVCYLASGGSCVDCLDPGVSPGNTCAVS
jgi:hypothetical protein